MNWPEAVLDHATKDPICNSVSFQARPRPAGAPEPVPRPGPGLRRPGPHAEPTVGVCALRRDERADLQALRRLRLRGGLPRGVWQARAPERPLSSPSSAHGRAFRFIQVAGSVAPAKVGAKMKFVCVVPLKGLSGVRTGLRAASGH